MRQLTSHLESDQPVKLLVTASDDPGFGSTCHRYEISGFAPAVSHFTANDGTMVNSVGQGKTTILFQNGPVVPMAGYNGITIQSLLALVNEKLQKASLGDGSDDSSNEVVMEKLRRAIMVLNLRDSGSKMASVERNVEHRVPALN